MKALKSYGYAAAAIAVLLAATLQTRADSDRAALQMAFMAAHRDPQYIADAATVGVEISPVSADDLVKSLDQLAGASPQIFDYVRKLLAGNEGD